MLLEGRKHPRSVERILVEVSSVYNPLITEVASVENRSASGVQVATGRPWELGLFVNLKSVVGDLKARARVVYCKARGPRNYVVGLNILGRDLKPGRPRKRKVNQ